MSFHARTLTTATSFAALLVASGCGGPADEPAEPGWFVESAQARGIDFEWVSGHRERFYFPEIMGGGAALFDMDTDGTWTCTWCRPVASTTPGIASPTGCSRTKARSRPGASAT